MLYIKVVVWRGFAGRELKAHRGEFKNEEAPRGAFKGGFQPCWSGSAGQEAYA